MASALHQALTCRCPRCGEGRLFSGFLEVVERCETCGLNLAKNDSGDGPAVFLIFIIGAITVPLAIWIQVSFDVPLWLPALIACIATIALTLALLRPAKAYVIALQYRHRREDYED